MRTEDIARFGQLYLQKGSWNGRTLLRPDWVDLATSRHVSNGSNPKSDWEQGYGFQFWRCRNAAYRGDGAFGQYCIVLPEQDAVIAITSGLKDMQAVLNLIWEKLLPALAPQRLKRDAPNQKRLLHRFASLTVRPAEGAATSPLASKVLGRKFVFPTNEQKLETVTLSTDPAGHGVTIALQSAGLTHQFVAGYREWKKGRGSFSTYVDEPAAATGAWTTDDTFVVKQAFYETPFYVTRKLRLDGDRLLYDAESNVGFRATKQPQLIGRVE